MKKFVRTIENFTCGHCGAEVVGNGYTNHCPKCLWGKHVDVFPGDRAEKCGGMMEPISLSKKKEKFSITHRCILCGEERSNVASPDDALEVLLGR